MRDPGDPKPKRRVNRQPPKRTSPDLLDYGQVADRLNVSEATVRRLVDMGRLKTVSVSPSGRKRMVRVADLEVYLEDNSGYRTSQEEAKPKYAPNVFAALYKAGWDGDEHECKPRKPR